MKFFPTIKLKNIKASATCNEKGSPDNHWGYA